MFERKTVQTIERELREAWSDAARAAALASRRYRGYGKRNRRDAIRAEYSKAGGKIGTQRQDARYFYKLATKGGWEISSMIKRQSSRPRQIFARLRQEYSAREGRPQDLKIRPKRARFR